MASTLETLLAQKRADTDAIPNAISNFLAVKNMQQENLLKQMTIQATLATKGLKLDPTTGSIVQDPSLVDPNDLLKQQLMQSQIGLLGAKQKQIEGQTFATGDQTIDTSTPQGQQDYLKSLPSSMQNTVKGLVEGRIDARSLGRGQNRQQLIEAAATLDPGFDMGKAQARFKMRQDFTSGKYSQALNSANTVLGHLDTLQTKLDSLHNTQIPLINQATNTFKQATGQSAISGANEAADAVASEMMKVYRNTGQGSVQEIESWRKNFDVNASPAQQKEYIKTGIELLTSKIGAIKSQWDSTMGIPMDVPFLNAKSQKVLQKFGEGDLVQGASSQTSQNNDPLGLRS